MRIWSDANPVLLNREDLGREHRHIHEIATAGKDPEALSLDREMVDRWMGDVEMRRALIFRHELVRLALNYRWPGHHRTGRHPTPMKRSALNDAQAWALRNFAGQLKRAYQQEIPPSCAPHECNNQFIVMMKQVEFPRDPIHTETPWKALGIEILEYVTGDNYWHDDLQYREHNRARIARKRRRGL